VTGCRRNNSFTDCLSNCHLLSGACNSLMLGHMFPAPECLDCFKTYRPTAISVRPNACICGLPVQHYLQVKTEPIEIFVYLCSAAENFRCIEPCIQLAKMQVMETDENLKPAFKELYLMYFLLLQCQNLTIWSSCAVLPLTTSRSHLAEERAIFNI
jgi:hypothetical protein